MEMVGLYRVLRSRFFGRECAEEGDFGADVEGVACVADEEDGGVSSAMENATEGDDAAPVEDYRVIFVNRAQPPVPKFVNNRVSTAKYR